MFGASPFGSNVFGATPNVGNLVIESTGRMVGEAVLRGSPQRAYDQLFPASVFDGATVVIGNRLYLWKANTGRWTPGGPVDQNTVTVDLATLFLANLFGTSGSIAAIPGTDTIPDLLPVFNAHLVTGSDDSLATIPGGEEVEDLAATFNAHL